jgi:hypothetical protein
MINKLKLSVSAGALALLMVGSISSAQAADVVQEPGCSFNGSVMAGYMYNWQDVSSEFSSFGDDITEKDEDFDGEPEWQTPFGEGAALVTCGGLNIQADFAAYNHTNDIDGKDEDLEQDNRHGGGALFYRDGSFAGGLSASLISQDITGKDSDMYRVGLFGEFYFDDVFTLGASAHYYNRDEVEGKDEDGFELAAWGRFYATPNFGLMLRGDVLLPNSSFDVGDDVPPGLDFDVDVDQGTGWAVTGEAEYLVWDQGLTIFGGARYAERSLDFNFDIAPDPDVHLRFDNDIEDLQVYAGLKFYFDFGGGKTLVENHRTGAFDNTSVFHEKLPEALASSVAGIADDFDEGPVAVVLAPN